MPTMPQNIFGPHQPNILQAAGEDVDKAKAAMILIHGRGASAPGILSLAQEYNTPHIAYVAPQATGGSWYPYSFLAELSYNQPGLDSGLQAIADALTHLTQVGIPAHKIIIGGFSQGACLAMEFIARNAQRYGGAFAYSGGLIGPDGSPRDYAGSLNGTPIFLGCSDYDHHIPLERVQETTAVLQTLGGQVTQKIYPHIGHTITYDEIQQVQALMQTLLNP